MGDTVCGYSMRCYHVRDGSSVFILMAPLGRGVQVATAHWYVIYYLGATAGRSILSMGPRAIITTVVH